MEASSRVPKSFFFIRSRFSNWKKFCKRIVVITATEHTLLQVLWFHERLSFMACLLTTSIFFWGLRRYTSISNALMT
ncbi:hypothetical protein EIA08_33550, partial [Escherichia coli]